MEKIRYFSKGELMLWLCSVLVVLLSFFIFDGNGLIRPAASVIGITALIFNAKGNPAGQLMMIVFSLMYGVISYTFRYYGEMITYLGMSMPMACAALVSWVKNPYEKGKAEVAVNRISKKEYAFMALLTAAVTGVFYFILAALNTANLVPSTVSVATSFAAVYLTFRRSPYYAVAYAANDAVLIVLWIMAAVYDISYISVAVCFAAFLANDIYGFISWTEMEKRQYEHYNH